jgi:hypothetical protein
MPATWNSWSIRIAGLRASSASAATGYSVASWTGVVPDEHLGGVAYLKSAMLEWLATAEPGLRTIVTGNADSNEHMIAINEQLGYEQVHPGWQAQTLDIAAFVSRCRSV